MSEVEGLFIDNVEGLRKTNFPQAKGMCPFHSDNTPSFSVNMETGLWKCFAGCGQGNAKEFERRMGQLLADSIKGAVLGPNAAAALEALRGGGKLQVFRMKDLIELVRDAGEDKDEWFLEKIIAAESVVMLSGSPKAGKSTFAAGLVAALAQGEPFLGLGTARVKTLWIGLEERRRDVAKKFVQLGVVHGIRYVGGPLRASPAAFEMLRECIAREGIRLVVIDTLANFWIVRDENSAPETEKALEPIRQLARDLKIAVLILHHTRKGEVQGGESIRGSSAIFGVVDTSIAMIEGKGLGQNERTFEIQSRLSGRFELRAQYLDGRYRVMGKDDLNGRDQLLLKQLSKEFQTAEILGGKIDVAGTTARRACEELARKAPKIVRVKGSGKKGDPKRYALAKSSARIAQEAA